ncbi:MAG TPA: hypothetical protein VHG72_14600 [Polyangia bacterium]|nr:hypothetical protein [Polyangia bacterium]
MSRRRGLRAGLRRRGVPIGSGNDRLTSVTHCGTGAQSGIKTAEHIIDATAKTIRIGRRGAARPAARFAAPTAVCNRYGHARARAAA